MVMWLGINSPPKFCHSGCMVLWLNIFKIQKPLRAKPKDGLLMHYPISQFTGQQWKTVSFI